MSHLRRFVAFWLPAVVLFGLVLFSCRREQGVRIGVALPLSGSMAEYGQNARNGVELAVEDLQKLRDAPRLTILYQDTKDAPQETVDAVRRLVDVQNVHFIVGGLTSSGVLAAAPYAQAHGALFFTPAASAPGIPEIGPLVFRNWPGDNAIAAQFGAAAVKRLRASRVAILYVNNDYGKVNADAFATALRSNGGRIIVARAFAQGNTDFRTLLAATQSAGSIDKLFVIAYPDEYRALFQQLGDTAPSSLLVSDTFYSPALLHELAGRADGVICAVAAKPGANYAPRQTFITKYRNRFAKEPGLVADTAYDAVRILADAIQHTDGSPSTVANWMLANVKDYQGVAGPTTFSATGDVAGSLALYEVRGGQFRPVSP
ncbi:MAG TPA: penicillin-binding protein activator [Thermoanaerobaculia bacterium]|nr:penicillin-binding protein activator [Thermoanaerobaculia bacterium]